MTHAKAPHQKHLEAWTTPFPKAPSRWLSHYQFTPRPIALTRQGDVDGGLSWLIGATIDFSFTRPLCAPHYGTRGGCYGPASFVLLEVSAHVDHYVDYAHFCRALHQSDKGRRYRQLAGLHDHVPGEDDLCHCRYRVGDDVIHKIRAEVVELLRAFGLLKGELLATDGQLEPSYSRYKGYPYAREGCHDLRLDEAQRQALCKQLQSGAKRLQITCPFPDVVAKEREATAQKGYPQDPKVSLIEIEDAANGSASHAGRQQLATRLGLTQDEVPSVRLKGCHLSRGLQGELLGSCPKVPSDLKAKVGHHVDTKNPSQKEAVFGYV
jgi:hypothetical protein